MIWLEQNDKNELEERFDNNECDYYSKYFCSFVCPIVAVWIGQVLLDRTEKRKDKMSIFRSLVSSRVYGWTVESVNALNLIELV